MLLQLPQLLGPEEVLSMRARLSDDALWLDGRTSAGPQAVQVKRNEQLMQDTDGIWGWFAIVEMLIFIGILVLGLAYAWVKGHLEWIKPETKQPSYESPVPKQLYDKINQKYGR